MADITSLKSSLLQGLKAFGIPTPPTGAVDKLLEYQRLLFEYNTQVNLIGPCTETEFIGRHLLDSLSPWSFFEKKALLDFGSGGGLPGIPLAIVLDIPVTLCESKEKKTIFLESCKKNLHLDKVTIEPHNVMELRGHWPQITARAFGPIEKIIRLTSRILAPGGRLLIYKGKKEKIIEEISEIIPGISKKLTIKRKPLSIPGLDRERHLVIVQKS